MAKGRGFNRFTKSCFQLLINNLNPTTALDIKRIENAFFDSMYIFLVILHAIENKTYQLDPQSLLIKYITLIMHYMTVT